MKDQDIRIHAEIAAKLNFAAHQSTFPLLRALRVPGKVGAVVYGAVLLLLLVLSEPSRAQDAKEMLSWESVECESALQVQAYLDVYPNGAYVDEAQACLEGQLGLDREERRLVQQGLAALDYSPGVADGLFGPATRRAIQAWQRAKELVATGYLTRAQADTLMAQGRAVVALRSEATQSREFRNSLGMEFVLIEPGTFEMGSPNGEAGRSDDEVLHQVTISEPFYLGKYEVTQAQWAAMMGNNPSRFPDCGSNCPVEKVSWEDVQEFIGALNRRERVRVYRLPTEAEWEYAARAGRQTAIYTGRLTIRGLHDAPALDSIAWYGGNSRVSYPGEVDCSGWAEKQYSSSQCGPHPVGRKQPNRWGLYDMLGNVWEWVADRYGQYPRGSVTDPRGPSTGATRVTRGGSWRNTARHCRAARRSWFVPGARYEGLGFRLAKTP